ncbi:hypothetical protein MA16_Dca013111 [Dendrobium catenatum]|uniref:Uncharacterized protein n=1 Tax=Dendrobium catenatum TaxID=906689 RepID=A0A2I0WD59_9ASPA|nr:hypothetical protein MA16_Dca013111 [Dendrobium catenatum]
MAERELTAARRIRQQATAEFEKACALRSAAVLVMLVFLYVMWTALELPRPIAEPLTQSILYAFLIRKLRSRDT